MPILSNEELTRTVKEYEKHGYNQTSAAEALGITRSTLQNRLARATSQGIGSHFIANEAGASTGLQVGATSTLYGPEGPKLQWVKRQWANPEVTIGAIKDAFEEFETRPPVIKPSFELLTQAKLTTVYPIADLHFGMYSWKEETGDDYDTAIASQTLLASFHELIGRSIPSDVGIVLNLGDYFHADNDEQRTRKSGNKVDVDTRYARVLREGVQLMLRVIELAKTQHAHVLVRNVQGNHDPYGTLALATALAAYYTGDERVTVDTSADPIWVWQTGRVLIAAAHGHMAKPIDMQGILTTRHPEKWGSSDYRYGYFGHIHQRRSFERNGLEVETFRTIAPKDAWGTEKGLVAGRSLVGITHDHKKGEVHRATVNVR